MTGFVEGPEGPHSAYFASCHDHDQRVAWIDVLLGTWSVEPAPEDHVTFSCGLRADGAMAMDAPVAVDLAGVIQDARAALLGRMMTRQDALGHPWIAEFWAAVDAIAVQDRSRWLPFRRQTGRSRRTTGPARVSRLGSPPLPMTVRAPLRTS